MLASFLRFFCEHLGSGPAWKRCAVLRSTSGARSNVRKKTKSQTLSNLDQIDITNDISIVHVGLASKLPRKRSVVCKTLSVGSSRTQETDSSAL